jgi:hypothetical protein
MTPAERVVVEAAVRYATSPATATDLHNGLCDAVEALLAERAGPQPETVEITWEQVVTGDLVYRALNGAPLAPDAPGGKWFEVLQTGRKAPDRVRINVRGIARPIQPLAGAVVIVKRSAMGQAVDVLASVLWSGPTSREQ